MTENYDPRDHCAMCGQAWEDCAERTGNLCRDCLEAYEDELTSDVERPPNDERYAMTCSEMAEELGEKTGTVDAQVRAAMAKFERNWKQTHGVKSWNEWRKAITGG